MPKNVQIPYELFCDLVKYHILEQYALESTIKKGLQNKLDTAINRELYSKYKDKNLSPEEREKARIEYLDRKGYLEDFRY